MTYGFAVGKNSQWKLVLRSRAHIGTLSLSPDSRSDPVGRTSEREELRCDTELLLPYCLAFSAVSDDDVITLNIKLFKAIFSGLALGEEFMR